MNYSNGQIFIEMSNASQNAIEQLNKIHKGLSFSSPTYFLVYGSLSRYEFLPNSDLDLIILSKSASNPVFQNYVVAALKSLPCEKNDIKFLTPDDIISLANTSIIEGEYIRSAKSINNKATEGIQDILKQTEKIFTKNWLEQKFVFHYFFFEKYVYPSKSTETSPSLKYSPGAIRDAIFLDWFLEFEGQYINNTFSPITLKKPAVETALESSSFRNLFSLDHIENVKQAISFLFWIKEHSLILNKETSKHGKAFMDDTLANGLINNFPILPSMGANTPNTLRALYSAQRKKLFLMKEIIFLHLIQSWGKEKGSNWLAIANQLLNKDFTNYRIALSDEILRIILIWMSHEDLKLFRKLISEVNNHNWVTLMSFCTFPKCPADFLDYVAENFASNAGYEHIAKLIITNPNTSFHALELVAGLNKMPEKYKLLVAKRLEHIELPATTYQKILWGKT